VLILETADRVAPRGTARIRGSFRSSADRLVLDRPTGAASSVVRVHHHLPDDIGDRPVPGDHKAGCGRNSATLRREQSQVHCAYRPILLRRKPAPAPTVSTSLNTWKKPQRLTFTMAQGSRESARGARKSRDPRSHRNLRHRPRRRNFIQPLCKSARNLQITINCRPENTAMPVVPVSRMIG